MKIKLRRLLFLTLFFMTFFLSNAFSALSYYRFIDWQSITLSWSDKLLSNYSLSLSSKKSEKKPDWAYFDFVNKKKRSCDIYAKEYQKSKFFTFFVQDWASYFPRAFVYGGKRFFRIRYYDFKDFKEKIIFDFCKKVNITFSDFDIFVKSFWEDKFNGKRFYDEFKKYHANKPKTFDKFFLINEITSGESARYKVHVQIKPKFLKKFIEELAEFLLEQKNKCKENEGYFYSFKATEHFWSGWFTKNDKRDCLFGNYFDEEENIPKDPPAIIVLYLPLLPGDKNINNKRITDILNPLVDFYQKFDSQFREAIELKIKPRFNRKIYKGIYIAGGEGGIKEDYIEKKKWFMNCFFTNDGAFFKGAEYTDKFCESNFFGIMNDYINQLMYVLGIKE